MSGTFHIAEYLLWSHFEGVTVLFGWMSYGGKSNALIMISQLQLVGDWLKSSAAPVKEHYQGTPKRRTYRRLGKGTIETDVGKSTPIQKGLKRLALILSVVCIT